MSGNPWGDPRVEEYYASIEVPKPAPFQPVMLELVCLHCNKHFEWMLNKSTDMRPKFCKKHRDAKSRCPNPHKEAHPTKASAVSAAAHANRLRKTSLRTYECSCGRWHLTSRVVAK